MCNQLKLISPFYFAIALVLHLAYTKNSRLLQLSGSVHRMSTNPPHPGLLAHNVSKRQPSLHFEYLPGNEALFPKEIASCSNSFHPPG